VIDMKKEEHPLSALIGTWDDVPDFTDEEYAKAKESLFKMPS
jgi:hypothetical protein